LAKIFIVLALAIVLYSSKKIVNLAIGPAQLGEEQLAVIAKPAMNMRDYATVRGRDTDSTGIQAIEETTRNGVVESKQVTGEYMFTLVGKRILIVKARTNEKVEIYTGAIVPLPADLKKDIFSNTQGVKDAEVAQLEAATFPIMLDASEDYASFVWPTLFCAGIFIIPAAWWFHLCKKRTDSPEKHPLAKAISQYGPLYILVPQIDAEVNAGSAYLLGVRMTDDWLISCTVTNSTVMRRDEIVWAYKKRTKRSINFIPTGTTYSSVLRDSRGKAFEINAPNEQQADGFLSGIVNRSPWIVVGYDKKVEKLYSKNVGEFSALVAQRKAEFTSQA
jgi:hypothetical protein